MADNFMLDKALGFFSTINDARRESRNDLMRTILPEVLQPEELKQATAPMKEEASKTLHAPKYDRRMKFNTALERSGHKATSEEPAQAKEDPAWLKEAVRKIAGDPAFDFSGVTGREGVVTVEDELERTPPLPTEEPMEYDVSNKPVMQKESTDTEDMVRRRISQNIEYDPSKDVNPYSRREDPSDKTRPYWGAAAFGSVPVLTGIAAALGGAPVNKGLLAVTGAAGLGLGGMGYYLTRKNISEKNRKMQNLADALNAGYPSENQRREDLFNNEIRPALESFLRAEVEKAQQEDLANANKTAAYPDDTETFTQRHPWILPTGIGLLGAAAGAIPGGLLGGRHAVSSARRQYMKRMMDTKNAYRKAVADFNEFPTSPNFSQKGFDNLRDKIKWTRREWDRVSEEPMDFAKHRAYGRAAGGALGGLTGGSLGVLGGLAANKPQPWEQ